MISMGRIMFVRIWLKLFLLIFVPSLQAANEPTEFQIQMLQQMKQLTMQVQTLQHRLQEVETQLHNTQTAKAVEGTQSNLDDNVKVSNNKDNILVDLSDQENTSIEDSFGSHVLSNPWWKNIEIHGFGAVGYYDTGSAATRDYGGFEIKESSLFVEAEVWEDIALFWEIQANRLGKDDQLLIRTGEIYAHFRNLELGDLPVFGVKAGRFDIPFGEEYLWQDSIDNPLITNSAPYPYGWDEGVLIYSEFKGVNWILAVTDGTDARSSEENSDKAVNIKLYGNPLDSLYLSGSFMYNGNASKSAIEFGGSHFRPVGASHQSSLGSSSSDEVESGLVEFDAKYSFHSSSFDGYIAASLGGATQDDSNPSFDRDFFWYSIEPFVSYHNTWYAVARYSEIGTYDDDEGYHFDGKTFAGGNSAFGYDTRRFRRLALGLGWTPNPNVRAKLEIGQDWFDLIRSSTISTNNDDRKFIGAEVAVGF